MPTLPHALDRRTRLDADLRTLTPSEFFEAQFPALAARNGRAVARAMAELPAQPLSLAVDEAVWSIECVDGTTIRATPAPIEGALTVQLTPEQFSDWAQNQMSFNGLLVARSLSC